MPCSTHKHAKTTKGWRRVSSGQRRRRALAARCPGAFAVKKNGVLHFPLVAEKGSCCLDCRAARVALQRAVQHAKRYPGVASRIRARAKAAGCDWARKPAKKKRGRR